MEKKLTPAEEVRRLREAWLQKGIPVDEAPAAAGDFNPEDVPNPENQLPQPENQLPQPENQLPQPENQQPQPENQQPQSGNGKFICFSEEQFKNLLETIKNNRPVASLSPAPIAGNMVEATSCPTPPQVHSIQETLSPKAGTSYQSRNLSPSPVPEWLIDSNTPSPTKNDGISIEAKAKTPTPEWYVKFRADLANRSPSPEQGPSTTALVPFGRRSDSPPTPEWLRKLRGTNSSSSFKDGTVARKRSPSPEWLGSYGYKRDTSFGKGVVALPSARDKAGRFMPKTGCGSQARLSPDEAADAMMRSFRSTVAASKGKGKKPASKTAADEPKKKRGRPTKKASDDSEVPKCGICWDTTRPLFMTTCGHLFHTKCLQLWNTTRRTLREEGEEKNSSSDESEKSEGGKCASCKQRYYFTYQYFG